MEGGTEGRSDGLMEGRETGGREDREERTEGADSRRGGGQRGRRGASGAAGPLRESSRRPRAAADRRREPPRRAAAPFGAARPPPLPRPPPARPPPPASRAAQRSRADPDGTDRSRQGGTGRGGAGSNRGRAAIGSPELGADQWGLTPKSGLGLCAPSAPPPFSSSSPIPLRAGYRGAAPGAGIAASWGPRGPRPLSSLRSPQPGRNVTPCPQESCGGGERKSWKCTNKCRASPWSASLARGQRSAASVPRGVRGRQITGRAHNWERGPAAHPWHSRREIPDGRAAGRPPFVPTAWVALCRSGPPSPEVAARIGVLHAALTHGDEEIPELWGDIGLHPDPLSATRRGTPLLGCGKPLRQRAGPAGCAPQPSSSSRCQGEGFSPSSHAPRDTQTAPRGAADPQPFPSLHPKPCSGVEFSLISPRPTGDGLQLVSTDVSHLATNVFLRRKLT